MITNIDCITPLGNSVTLSLDPSQSPYVVKNIDGLGPVSANIARTNYVTKDGSIFQNARAGDRNIVITLGLNADYSTTTDPYGELRRSLYPVLGPKSEVKLVIESTELETVEISGWVESFEPAIFSKDPDVQISIICPDPYFSSQVNVVATRTGQGLLTVTNPGNVETGFTLLVDGFTTPTYPLSFNRTLPTAKTMEYRGGMYIQGNLMSLYFVTHQGYKQAEWDVSGFNEGGSGATDPFAPFDGLPVLGFVNGWGSVLPGSNTFNLVINGQVAGPAVTTMFFKPKYMGF